MYIGLFGILYLFMEWILYIGSSGCLFQRLGLGVVLTIFSRCSGLMKILSWNYRGLGSKWTISYLREIRWKHKPVFLFLSETKQHFNFVQSFQFYFRYSHLHTVDPLGRSGGLALFYDSTYKVNIISSSNIIIDVETEYNGK